MRVAGSIILGVIGAGERTRSTSTIRDADGSVKQQETGVHDTRVGSER